MLRFVFRILRFSGKYAGALKFSFVLSFLEGILQNVPIVCIWMLFTKCIEQSITAGDAGFFGTVIAVSLLVRIFLRYWFVVLESGTGYEICERERTTLGERLRHFSMRFFSAGNLGNVASVITVDLPFIEEQGMSALDKVISGYISSVIGTVFLCFVDIRVGLIAVISFALAALLFVWIERIGKSQSYTRQKQQSTLVAAVLEYVQGISVIKAFNLGGSRAKTIEHTIEQTCHHSLDFEKQLTLPSFLYKAILGLGTAGVMLTAALLAVQGQLAASTVIMIVIYSFLLFTPATAFASLSSQVRVMEAGLNRYEALKTQKLMPEGNTPADAREEVRFENVTFGYNETAVLDNISFVTKPHSVTALVGPSGGGKTTVANLLARFWDVDSGRITIGGTDIRDMRYDELLANISMVFQDVYLFHDTMRSNICFGAPDIGEKEMIAAAKKARCHDFIMALPEGYDTVLGEGGGTLSGGERQRIAIARAMLKDAPVVILDEATASVDPDNEGEIQQAIGELIQNKTLIMIAHRLTTIKNADQILMVDEKQILEHGNHEELMAIKGKYYNLWQRRQKAIGWKVGRK